MITESKFLTSNPGADAAADAKLKEAASIEASLREKLQAARLGFRVWGFRVLGFRVLGF